MPGRCDGVRAVALVGPTLSGKTSLMEALLQAAGSNDRPGSVGDQSPEARAREHSTEPSFASFSYLDDRYMLIDCPGAVDFAGDQPLLLPAADLVLIVVDADPARAHLAQPVFRAVEAAGVPHAVFVNRIDAARGRLRDLLAALQPMSRLPLVARQIPIRDGERVTGFIDLALERAYHYRVGKASEPVPIPEALTAREGEARLAMLEQLADHDDALLEELLSDIQPTPDHVFDDLRGELAAGQITPLMLGSASNGWGLRRLLKALRHDTPHWNAAAARLGAAGGSYVLKVSHAAQVGKLAIMRSFAPAMVEGCDLAAPSGEPSRAGALFALHGAQVTKVQQVPAGAIVAAAKVEQAQAGDIMAVGGAGNAARRRPAAAQPMAVLALTTRDRKDDVRLSGAIAKLVEEDPALEWRQEAVTHESLLGGVSAEHLRLALDRLQRRFGVAVETRPPSVGYRETVRKAVSARGRHKKQSGGHGQFGDVHIDLRPLPRGTGFAFSETVTGGAVPRQWIPAVEQGVRDAMEQGPLGFPVVDVEVTLTDGSYHSVDSSELAFRTAGRIAMSEALGLAQPYLLEPVVRLCVATPQAATSRISASISSRRGQILGFAPREGWHEWDVLEAQLPHAELLDLGSELRGLSQGLASFSWEPAFLAELGGKLADEIVRHARAA